MDGWMNGWMDGWMDGWRECYYVARVPETGISVDLIFVESPTFAISGADLFLCLFLGPCCDVVDLFAAFFWGAFL